MLPRVRGVSAAAATAAIAVVAVGAGAAVAAAAAVIAAAEEEEQQDDDDPRAGIIIVEEAAEAVVHGVSPLMLFWQVGRPLGPPPYTAIICLGAGCVRRFRSKFIRG